MSIIPICFIDPILDLIIKVKCKDELKKLKVECRRYERTRLHQFFQEKSKELFSKPK